MSDTSFKNVDEYIAGQPEAIRAELEHLRNTIRKTLPNAEEMISYKMPAYKLHGAIVLYFAGWKKHYSLYLASKRLISAFKGRLMPYKVVRGTIQFPLSGPIPTKLIEEIAKFRAEEDVEHEKSNAK